MLIFRARVALLMGVFLVGACGGSQARWPESMLAPGATTDAPGDDIGVDEPGFVPVEGASRGGPEAAFRTDVVTDPGELPSLKVAADANRPLPLQHTDVKATLAGFTADVQVSQTYSNPYDKPIEASYVFPLPENAAVYSMKMIIGSRVIEAVVKERGEARRTYDTAKQQGKTAALLEQERPNVFTQSVANIEPGKKIDVVIRYVQDLSYDAGEYEMVFPMVVGPRYIPGTPLDRAPSGNGTYADTAAVPDASRITPPVLGKGERSGHDISLDVMVSSEGLVSSYQVPTHEVVTEKRTDGVLHLKLSDKDQIPNRDFVLRYRVAGEKPKAILYAAGKDSGYFSLVVQPPKLDVEDLVGKRELIFVVDVSGSMSGSPLALCKTAIRDALGRMRPVDTFNVLVFAGATGKVFPKPRPANDSAIRDALEYVDRLTAGGGTEMKDAVAEALSADVEKGRNRYVFFLTDGFVGNEPQILASTESYVEALEAKGQRARVFGFGTGSSVNRMLLDGLGTRGKGLTVYATLREDPARAVNKYFRYIDRSVLRDVKVDFGALRATETFPAELPDLFASHPLILHGKFKGALTGPVVVRAKGASGPVEIPVTIARAPMDDGWPLQGLLWARSKIGSLEQDLWGESSSPGTREAITKLGIDHHLLTAFTSFVAVDESKKVGDGNPAHVTQPVETPEGVDPDAAGARSYSPESMANIPAPGDGYGYDFSDDPLAAGGFGPNDATIRVRSQAAPVMRGEVYAVQQVTRGPRGCNCEVAGSSSGGKRAVVTLALFALATTLRRRSRKAPSGKRFPD